MIKHNKRWTKPASYKVNHKIANFDSKQKKYLKTAQKDKHCISMGKQRPVTAIDLWPAFRLMCVRVDHVLVLLLFYCISWTVEEIF